MFGLFGLTIVCLEGVRMSSPCTSFGNVVHSHRNFYFFAISFVVNVRHYFEVSCALACIGQKFFFTRSLNYVVSQMKTSSVYSLNLTNWSGQKFGVYIFFLFRFPAGSPEKCTFSFRKIFSKSVTYKNGNSVPKYM